MVLYLLYTCSCEYGKETDCRRKYATLIDCLGVEIHFQKVWQLFWDNFKRD